MTRELLCFPTCRIAKSSWEAVGRLPAATLNYSCGLMKVKLSQCHPALQPARWLKQLRGGGPVAGETWINNPPLPHLAPWQERPGSITLLFLTCPSAGCLERSASPSHTHSQRWAVSVTVRSAAGFTYLKHIPSKKNYKFLSQVIVRLWRKGERSSG